MKKAVLYARVSSQEQEREGYSVPAQLKALQEYAEKLDLKIVREFIEIETAKVTGRKQFKAMQQYLRTHADVTELLVEKTDRLYRNFNDYVDLDADKMGIRIHLVKENVVLSSESRSHEKLMHGIKVVLAKAYIDNLSEEVKKGMGQKVAQGGWPHKAPMGYRNRLEDRTIVIDSNIAPFIRKAFELAATALKSQAAIADELYAGGFRTLRKGTRIRKGHVAKILRNPIYYGVIPWNGNEFPGKHEPLISKDLFDRAQVALLKKHKPRQVKHHFTYAGLLSCGHCGCAITAEQKRKPSGKTYIYYRCTNGKGICENVVYLSERVVEEQLAEALRPIKIGAEIVEWTRQALLDSLKAERDFQEAALTQLTTRSRTLQDRIDRCYIDKLEGRIELEDWERRSAEWKREQSGLVVQIQAHQNANTAYMRHGLKLMELASRAHELFFSMEPSEKRETLSLVLSNPEVFDGSIRYKYKTPFQLFAETGSLHIWLAR